MITIQQLKNMPDKERCGGFELTIKTAKKKWQIGDTWMHQVLLMDNTGEMLADVNIGKNIPLQRQQVIRIIVAEVQDSESGKKLYIDQFTIVSATEPEWESGQMWDAVTEGKIRHGLVCSLIRAKGQIYIGDSEKEDINSLVKFIQTGKIK